MKRILFLLIFIQSTSLFSQQIKFEGKPALFAPGIVSTDKAEVKITFSRDGKLMLWGTIGWENGKGGWDIWLSRKTDNGWSIPEPASFNSESNDFDPSFSVDGRKVYFFSNRPGGFGGDDIYYVSYNPGSGKFGASVNMGKEINTPGDEWGPAESVDGKKILFCSDGMKGKGMHDIFVCTKTINGWSKPENISAVNFEGDDFDPVFLHDNSTILFTRKISEDEAFLFISYLTKEGYSVPVRINSQMNSSGTWNFGSSVNAIEKNYIYYSSYFKENTKGRLDIYRIKCIIE